MSQVAVSALDKGAELDVLNHPILNLCYYMASFDFSPLHAFVNMIYGVNI